MTETVSIPEIKERLAERCVELAEYLFGKPTRRWRHELRFRSHGSLVVTISGRWRGRFRSWEADVGGSMLDAIMFANGYHDDQAALDWAKDYLGIRDDRPLPPRPKIRYAPDGPDPSIERQQQARRLWAAGVSIGGTLGETYLRTVRGIHSNIWPNSRPRRSAFTSTAGGDSTGKARSRTSRSSAATSCAPQTAATPTNGKQRV